MKRIRFQWPEEWQKRKKLFVADISYSAKDFIVSMSLYLLSVIFCLVLRRFDPHNDTSYVAVIFLLEVFLTALLTDGFFFSLVMSVFAVLSVDYIFTPPYWAVSFTLTGFPLTFLVTLTISVATGIVTSRAKKVSVMEREAEREKIHSNLLRAVSHDIRTPLTGIVGATNVLLEQEDSLTPQQRHELLKNANEDAQWLIHIVENLLSITRIGAENARVEKSPEVPEEVIEGAVAKFRRRHPEIEIRVELPEELMLVPMDPLLIQQVLTNLLENAATHGETTTQITVRLVHSGKWSRCTVEDNGKGIPASRLEHLFDGSQSAVQQGDRGRSMGIGLSVCRTVVQAHGGRIRGENMRSGGARFTVDLPLEEEENEDQG